jgi:trimethylamine--corrinoid protein Co-methyltransferase
MTDTVEATTWSTTPPLAPIRTTRRVRFLDDDQLDRLQEATLHVLETVGVKFPNERSLEILAANGCQVDAASQVVRFPRDVVRRAMATVPRTFTMGARNPDFDLHLEEGTTYYTLDGCGVAAIDPETGEERPSRKSDLEAQARVADWLPGIGFLWPTVSAQDFGRTSQLHEIDAAFNNSVKHFQAMVMGEEAARFAVEMATVVAGSPAALRARPVLSNLVCSVAPLAQDHAGLESALVMAEAGVPVGILSMPTLGTTAPATSAGAFVVGDAECISGIVLLQLAFPGTPVFHSIMKAYADPRTGVYVGYSLNAGTARYAPVEMAHHWGVPSMAACFGTDSVAPGTWHAAQDVALDPLLGGLAGPELVTGLGLDRTYTLLTPEGILLDYELYQRARYALMALDVSDETLALDVIAAVGPASHYLAEEHTRKHMRHALVRGLEHELVAGTRYRDPVEVARERALWVRANHRPQPLEAATQAELGRILEAARAVLG